MNTIMKRVRLKGDTAVVYRVPEELAQSLVKGGQYVYATRTEWKAAGRKMTYPSSVADKVILWRFWDRPPSGEEVTNG